MGKRKIGVLFEVKFFFEYYEKTFCDNG